MQLNSCAACGSERDLAQHVLRQLVYDDGERENIEITLCARCRFVVAISHSSMTAHQAAVRREVEQILRLAPQRPSLQEIADQLNGVKLLTVRGRPWTTSSVYNMLNKLGLQPPARMAQVPLPMIPSEEIQTP